VNTKKKILTIRLAALFCMLLAGGCMVTVPFLAPFPLFVAAGLVTWANRLFEKECVQTEAI
jgi:hypothetical protein